MRTPSKAAFQPNQAGDMERVRCLEALAAAMVRELEQSLADVSADAGACQRMLSAHSLDFQRAQDAALRTMQGANRAAAVIRRMWALFAKTEGNNQSVDLNQAVAEALVLASPKLQQRRVIVRRDLEANLPQITGDSLQLQQVILNLVSNAAEAMNQVEDRPRELVVRTQTCDGQVRLSVRDVGHGFAPRAAERLFDAFYTTKADGMGVGLFISRWIIENHAGAIYGALNDGPGATFSFVISPRSEHK